MIFKRYIIFSHYFPAESLDLFIDKVIEWIRVVPLASIEVIDLKNNYLTGNSFNYLLTWLLSLAAADLTRPTPISIDLKNNLVL